MTITVLLSCSLSASYSPFFFKLLKQPASAWHCCSICVVVAEAHAVVTTVASQQEDSRLEPAS